jgi:DNA-directed RNA polymerase subunit K/omega
MSDFEGSEADDFQYLDDIDEDHGHYYDEEIETNGHEKDEEDIRQDQLQEFDEDGNVILSAEPEAEEEDEDDTEEETPEEKTNTNIIPKNMRRTHPIMTKFEYSYLVSQRATAIEHDSPLMLPETKFIHAIDIAKEETEKGVNPIVIQRVMPNGNIEEWYCSELKLPKSYI